MTDPWFSYFGLIHSLSNGPLAICVQLERNEPNEGRNRKKNYEQYMSGKKGYRIEW